MTALATELQETLLQTYLENRQQAADYDISHHSIARRSLKNRCLGWLMQLQDESIQALCLEQYHAQHNMTDVIAALSLIAHGDQPQRQTILEDFRARWATDPLVLDKWFSVQAVSKRQDTGEEVVHLLGHPAFSMSNPNRVRSLVGAFCSANPVNFHRADGSGYTFLAERVMELDRFNPQIAARLLRSMARWRRYDPPRQQLMKEQLARILATEQVSRDVFEVASKSLGGG